MLNGTQIDLEQLRIRPALLSELGREQLTELIGECERLKALYWARLMSISVPIVPTEPKVDDRNDWGTAKEGATMLMRKVSWLYRNKHLPAVKKFVKQDKPGSPLRCSKRGIRDYLARM
jgi:hypothetical protein